MTAALPAGAVAAGHPETVGAACEVLRQGGNAVDAAIAGAFASLVSEPVLTSLWGGGLLTVRHPDGRAQVLDFFARVPGLEGAGIGPALDFRSVHIDFGPVTQEFHVGPGAAAVPGTLGGLFEAHRLWGSRPMEALVEPACDLAVRGVPLSSQMAYIFELLRPILTYSDEVTALFAPGGDLLKVGERFASPDLADLLPRLAREGRGGPTARALEGVVVERFGGGPGLLTHRDLAAARPLLREPRVVPFKQAQVILPPPPLLGGSLVALGLSLLSALPQAGPRDLHTALSVARVQGSMSEARRADPAIFLSDQGMAERLSAVTRDLAGEGLLGSTTHIGAVDASGLAVGITHSNGEGCGLVVPGSGCMMNNFLGEDDINPLGFHKQSPGEEMLTMMCPTIIAAGEGAATAIWTLGSGGSNRIRSAILQVVNQLVTHGMSPEEAVTAPRFHVEGPRINMELRGLRPEVVEALEAVYAESVRFSEPNMFFGGAHLAGLGPGGFVGVGDVRRGGWFAVAQNPR